MKGKGSYIDVLGNFALASWYPLACLSFLVPVLWYYSITPKYCFNYKVDHVSRFSRDLYYGHKFDVVLTAADSRFCFYDFTEYGAV